jgi:hypothetical protein
MTLRILRDLFIVGALSGGIVGLAMADTPPDSKAADAPAAPPAPSPETLKKARDAGLKPEVRKGITVYCWEDAEIGTHFKTKKCVNDTQLAQVIEQRQAAKDQLTRGGGNYAASK